MFHIIVELFYFPSQKDCALTQLLGDTSTLHHLAVPCYRLSSQYFPFSGLYMSLANDLEFIVG